MKYTLTVKKIEVPEEESFTRRVKVSVKGDVRFDFNLDEREHTYQVPVVAGQEVRVDYGHQGCAAPEVCTFTAGDGGRDLDGFSILLEVDEAETAVDPEPPAEVPVVDDSAESDEDSDVEVDDSDV